MKLVNVNELMKDINIFAKNNLSVSQVKWDNVFEQRLVDPADLEKMNLAALGVLKQAKDRFEVWKSNGVESMDAVLREIAHFESALKAVQLIQEKAKLWDRVSEDHGGLLEELLRRKKQEDDLEKVQAQKGNKTHE